MSTVKILKRAWHRVWTCRVLGLFGTFLVVASSIFLVAACNKETSTRLQEIEFQELNVQTPEVTLHTRVAGNLESGNVLIAINGGPGLSSHYMLGLEDLAGENFAVVTYDQRGVSRSSAPPMDPAHYTIAKYVDDLEAVRVAVGVEKIHLFGHSWGGLVAMHYAAIYPAQVRSIVLMGSAPAAWKELASGFAHFEARVRELQAQGILPQDLTRQDGQDDPTLRAFFSDPNFNFAPDDKGGPPEFSQIASEMTWAAIQGYDLKDEIAQLQLPILVLCGKDDPYAPLSEAVVTALTSAKVEYVVFDKCGHFWHECPEEFFSKVSAFLKLPAVP
jgi:proline iminopeptidase